MVALEFTSIHGTAPVASACVQHGNSIQVVDSELLGGACMPTDSKLWFVNKSGCRQQSALMGGGAANQGQCFISFRGRSELEEIERLKLPTATGCERKPSREGLAVTSGTGPGMSSWGERVMRVARAVVPIAHAAVRILLHRATADAA
jgi:hypothetical protein